MATSYRTADFDKIQVRNVYARAANNSVIPSSHILIANGDGSTHWSSISTILEISSFRTIKGNTATTFSADMSYNLLQISTTGIRGTFESYVDATTSTLMLSNAFPPIGVLQTGNAFGSAPAPSDAIASNLPGGVYMSPEDGNSTIKFVGIGSVLLSTCAAFKTTFIGISSFTHRGYSTISGETFALRPAIASTFSTAAGRATLMSSIVDTLWNKGAGFAMSTSGRDFYFSTATFDAGHLARYVDNSYESTTKLFVEMTPNCFFGTMGGGGLVKEVSSFIVVNSANSNVGYQFFPESVVTNYMTSQVTTAGQSNSFTAPLRMELNAYTSLWSNAQSVPVGLNFIVMHRIVNAVSNSPSDGGFAASSSNVDIRMSAKNGAFIHMFSQTPLGPNKVGAASGF
jgi:hypothetical protein